MNDDNKTRLISPATFTSNNDIDQNISELDSEETRMMKPESTSQETILHSNITTIESNESVVPVVGWLVIVDGTGKGRSVSLGYGQNTIGRGGGNKKPRICIDFGDSGISREKQFMIAYDAQARDFKLVPGDSLNITYLNGKAVYEAHTLNTNDLIKVSNTTFSFVPFCNEHFDWESKQ